MFLGLGITGLLKNSKKYFRILAIPLKAMCDGVYILQPPTYSFRSTRRPASSYDNDSRLNAPLKMIAFFQGIFHKLSPSCFYIVMPSCSNMNIWQGKHSEC